ncbi:sensor histidine kinase [Brevundimonas variabilis]|uniref:histidine kinase n=1 Tax=Brevundimonas variabilis TaxID=74312 RepID=A0A7W9CGC4_9CAUL|nr:sensor histidine kinase [Brevundimonas variabilis]MBB5745147.1 two-component sensor histidine kinase [Brevundimonas variabilis]
MALALLPILLLGGFQARGDFREQAAERKADLLLAAERSATEARAKLDSATLVLTVLSPESLGPFCGPRLGTLVDRLEGYDGLYRISSNGAIVCRAEAQTGLSASVTDTLWFERLKGGEDTVIVRSLAGVPQHPALIVAVRAQRPMGTFDGAMVGLIDLASLQPRVDDASLPAGAQAALTDSSGQILTATDMAAFATVNDGDPSFIEQTRSTETAIFEARDGTGQNRVYAVAALAGRDIQVLFSAPAPGWLSWARLNPIGLVLMPLAAWLTAFIAVMTVSERIIIRWLTYLERVASIYAKGRFTVRPTQAANAPSEIRVLANTLDELADTIQARDAALNEGLAEKDALMREIHHRVKNNLQIISSLLSMQQRALTDAPAKAALGDTRQRISALALIYRTLYQSDNIRHADARDFLTELIGQLVASEAGRGHLVTSSVQADSLLVDPDKLAPLALWLVEAVTNAQKHAFATRGGDLQVRFTVEGETSVLEVQDNGPGPDQAADSGGVGRTLMGAFAKQLRGSAELIPAPCGGTIARLVFATPEALTPTDPHDVSGTSGAVSR